MTEIGWSKEFAQQLVELICPRDRVTITNRLGQESAGKAVMRSSHGGWVLNMGGAHGTPGLVDAENLVAIPKRWPGKKLVGHPICLK